MSNIDKDGLSFFTDGANEESVGRTSVFHEVPKNRLDRMFTYRGDEEIGVLSLSALEEIAPTSSATHPSLSKGASTWQRAFILHGPSGLESSQISTRNSKAESSSRRGFRSLLGRKLSLPTQATTQDSKEAS